MPTGPTVRENARLKKRSTARANLLQAWYNRYERRGRAMPRSDVMTDRERHIEKAAQALQLAQADLERAGELKLAYEVALLQVMAEDKVAERVPPAP